MEWYNYVREDCDYILQTNENNVIGGPCIVVGKRVDGVWVFEGIERDSKSLGVFQPS